MKTEFPILNISPTQWVLVDKTRKPLPRELFCVPTGSIDQFQHSDPSVANHFVTGYHMPILAAYPKIEGVLLLPSTLWERQNAHELAVRKIPLGDSQNTIKDAKLKREGFVMGYEAAGGHTKDDMIDLLSWYASLNPSEKVSVWSKDGSQQVLFTMDNEQLVDRFIEKRSKGPRALEIEVGEDGSIPSQNGVIIYNKAIY